MKGKIDKAYKKICDVLNIKNVSWLSVIGFVLLLLPICYLSFINRATGDDLGFSSYTKLAWDSSHSLIEVLKCANPLRNSKPYTTISPNVEIKFFT